MTRIIIPTRGRLSKQLTLDNLPKELHEQTVVVSPRSERVFLQDRYQKAEVLAQPDDTWTIARKRQWIVEELCKDDEKIVMLDDDLRFAVRRDDEPTKFLKATPEQVAAAFRDLEQVLSDKVPHAGFSARGGGIGPAAQRGGWQIAKRQMYVLGYHIPTVLREVQFGRIETREDMDVTLQLLLKGFPNKVNYTFVVDQQFGNPGGCTKERTMERSNEDAKKLAEFHKPFVRVTQKDYAQSIPRLEVVCAWVQAYEEGSRRRVSRA